MSFNNPHKGVKVEIEGVDIWVGFTSTLLESGLMWVLHIHYLPDDEETRWKIYNQLRPFWKFRETISVNQGYEMIFRGHPHAGYGCITRLEIDAKDMEGSAMREEKGEPRQEIKAFLKKVFPTAKVILV